MVIFSAIAAAIGAVVAGIGAATAAVGATGAALGITATGLTAAAGAFGIAASGYGIYGQYAAGKQQAAASKRAEALRLQQTQLQLNNDAINNIRQAQSARANNLVRGTAQLGSGAQFGSAIANSNSSVESALGYQLDTTGQAGSLGFGIYAANAQYSDATTSRGIASGISSLGQTTLGNLGAINRVGSFIGGGGLTNGAFFDWDKATTTTYGS